MNNFWQTLISPHHYIPHGHCYLWQTPLVGLHITSDFAIALSYYLIPLMLVYFIRQREDVPFKGLFVLFGAFIITCGTTHLMAIWTLWHPAYWLSGIVKAITAMVSLYTALELFPIIPQALALPSPSQLQQLNQNLERQIRDRQAAETQVRQLNQNLEEQVEKRTQNLKEVNEKLEREIEERQNLMQKLSSSETYIRSILEAITDIILVLDEQCRVVEIPPTRPLLAAAGEKESLIDRTIKHILNRDRVDEYRQQVQDVLATQNPAIADYHLSKNGEEQWFSASIAPISQGRVIWIARDISPRKQMEYALRQSEARNRGIVSAIPDLMMRIDRNGYYLDYIPAKYGPELLCSDRAGKHISEVLPAEMIPLQMHAIAKALATRELQVYEQNIYIGDRRYDEEVRVAPSGEGEVLVIVRDISEQKQAEIALFEQMRLAALDAEIGMALTKNQDLQDTLECCTLGLARNLSTALVCIWTLEENELKRQAIAGEPAIIAEGDRLLEEKLNCDLVLRQQQPYICNTLTEDGEICCPDWACQYQLQAIAVYPLLVEEKAIGILLLCDRLDFSDTILHALTSVANGIALGINRHFANIALEQAKEAAETANLAKSQFLSNMSHELRTPLNAILGFSQILHQDETLLDKPREFIDIIERSGEHLLSLIDDILSMSKIEAGQVTLEELTFSLDLLLDNLYSMFQLQTQSRGIRLSFKRSPDLPPLLIGDEGKLRQVLINLLGNAIKFTERGSIILSVTSYQAGLKPEPASGCKQLCPEGSPVTSYRVTGKTSATLGATPTTNKTISNTTIYFKVRDTGMGISPEELPGIFAAFVQSESGRKSAQGTGLGLALTRKFVELMGGEITVSSRGYIFSSNDRSLKLLDRVDSQTIGTIFSFAIPFKVAEPASQTPSLKPIALAPGQPLYRILIADDLRPNRLLLRSLLAPLGFEITEARDGEEAIVLWKQWQPHLILMDMIMPAIDGEEATRQIRLKEKVESKKNPTLIIALTASAFDLDREQMLVAGCNDFLSKPFQAKILLEKIGKLLSVRYVYDASALEITPSLSKSPDDRDMLLALLATMPLLWLEKFYRVASVADEEGMRQQIATIPEEKADLTRSLSRLLDDFRTDLIFESIQTILGESLTNPSDLQ